MTKVPTVKRLPAGEIRVDQIICQRLGIRQGQLPFPPGNNLCQLAEFPIRAEWRLRGAGKKIDQQLAG
ncbi:hypothetical protein [Geomonas sp. Red276]